MKRIAVTFTAFVAVGALAGVAVGAGPASDPTARLAAPTGKLSWSARPVVRVVARRAPSSHARAITVVSPVGPLGSGEVRLLVTGVRRSQAGTWVQVMLPVRPNGRRGWVPADAMRFTASRYRVVIDQHRRQLVLLRSGRRVMAARVAIGTGSTPTPNGTFAVAEMINTGDPDGPLGRWVLPLTAYSPVLRSFSGGNGRVAIHGTSRPELLGQRVSHGCVRMGNTHIGRLVRAVRPGVPVIIRP